MLTLGNWTLIIIFSFSLSSKLFEEWMERENWIVGQVNWYHSPLLLFSFSLLFISISSFTFLFVPSVFISPLPILIHPLSLSISIFSPLVIAHHHLFPSNLVFYFLHPSSFLPSYLALKIPSFVSLHLSANNLGKEAWIEGEKGKGSEKSFFFINFYFVAPLFCLLTDYITTHHLFSLSLSLNFSLLFSCCGQVKGEEKMQRARHRSDTFCIYFSFFQHLF